MDLIQSLAKLLNGLSFSLLDVENAALVNTVEKLGLINANSIHLNLIVPKSEDGKNPSGKALIGTGEAQGWTPSSKIKSLPQSSTSVSLEVGGQSNQSKTVNVIKSVRPLSAQLGVFIRFSGTQWWDEAPSFLDIAPNVRIVTVKSRRATIPSIEADSEIPSRLIEVQINKGLISVLRRAPHQVLFVDMPCKGRKRIQRSSQQIWSIRAIRPSIPTVLNAQATPFAMEYDKTFASGVWCLTNHHRQRGEEIYLFLGNM